MAYYAASLENLIERLCGLPGIGPKSAQRIALYLLSIPRTDAVELAKAIVDVKDKVRFCSICFNISEGEVCNICSDERRDDSLLCVVEEPRDVIAIERSGSFRGRYHVLGGAISPIDGVGPDELRFTELMGRLRDGGVKEIVVATNPNAEGEATALYLAQLARPLAVRVTRIASGLPVGGDLEYADEITLGRAIEGRTEL
jgi:recombination protein RecR